MQARKESSNLKTSDTGNWKTYYLQTRWDIEGKNKWEDARLYPENTVQAPYILYNNAFFITRLNYFIAPTFPGRSRE